MVRYCTFTQVLRLSKRLILKGLFCLDAFIKKNSSLMLVGGLLARLPFNSVVKALLRFRHWHVFWNRTETFPVAQIHVFIVLFFIFMYLFFPADCQSDPCWCQPPSPSLGLAGTVGTVRSSPPSVRDGSFYWEKVKWLRHVCLCVRSQLRRLLLQTDTGLTGWASISAGTTPPPPPWQ